MQPFLRPHPFRALRWKPAGILLPALFLLLHQDAAGQQKPLWPYADDAMLQREIRLVAQRTGASAKTGDRLWCEYGEYIRMKLPPTASVTQSPPITGNAPKKGKKKGNRVPAHQGNGFIASNRCPVAGSASEFNIARPGTFLPTGTGIAIRRPSDRRREYSRIQ